jgi:hypothetical protein
MLIYPTLDRLIYDIREGLGQSEADVEKNRHYFKNKLPTEIAQQIDQFDIQGEYVELLGQSKIYRFEEAIYTGYYYPVRLNDSYSLLLDCSCRDPQSSDDLQWITGLKQCIEQKLTGKPATLGQTWVFYASVLNVPLEEYDIVAQKCYQALLPHADWYEDKTGASEFSGGKLFELWQETGETEHVIIILFANEKIAEKMMPALLQDELHWFWYRHKITWAYAQSRQLERLLKNKSIAINNLFDDFYKKADILENANKTLQSYFELLNCFESQAHTIETNLYNYQKRISKLPQKIAGLNFPNQFEQRTKEKYLLQIQRDQATFGLQLELIKNILTSVQARETHHNVKHIAAVQTKVEWLEVFFISFYAAEFSHILVELSHNQDFLEMGIVIWTALLGGVAAFFGLKLKGHVKLDRHFWLTVVMIAIAMLPLIGLGIFHSWETVKELAKSFILDQ